jgi:hypothetical protein
MAAGLTGVGGFGALYTLWCSGTWRQDLPGLFDYRSATWGDGLLLPASAAALVYAIDRLKPAANERRWSIAAALIGAASGGGTQVAWLADPAPRANWTFPGPHKFNYAGWYHAAYLTIASAGFAGLWALLVKRLASTSSEDHLRLLGFRMLSLALLHQGLFLVLIVIDNRPSKHTNATRTSTMVLIAAIIGLMAFIVWNLREPATTGEDPP